MKALRVLLAGLIVLAAPAMAQISVEPVAAGTPSSTQFDDQDTCESIYIQKSGNTWALVPGTPESLQDPTVEQLRGCLGFKGGGTVLDAIVFSADTKGICTTERRCEVNGNNRLAQGCHPIFQKSFYLTRTPRSNGYYACNSNFASRGMLGGLDFDAPIKTGLLAEALKSEQLKAAATSILQSRYRHLLGLALSEPAPDCNDYSCKPQREAIAFVFAHFGQQTGEADLQAAAFNYLKLTGRRKLPEWAGQRLAPGVVAGIEAKGAGVWRGRYDEQVRLVQAPGATLETLNRFVQHYSSPDPLNWKRTDLDNLVPPTQARIRQIVAARDAAAEAQAREARQAAAQRLAAWRKTLAVGSDTFCGPVIELRPPMVKLAINAQIQGYANESWLKVGEVFPPEQGCRNLNGRLSPLR